MIVIESVGVYCSVRDLGLQDCSTNKTGGTPVQATCLGVPNEIHAPHTARDALRMAALHILMHIPSPPHDGHRTRVLHPHAGASDATRRLLC